MDQFIDNDPDWERINKAKRGVLDMISFYRELLRERKLKKKTINSRRLHQEAEVRGRPTARSLI
jgi:hypothetical protein